MAPPQGQIPAWGRRIRDRVEDRLDAERDQLPLWLPVMLGLGIALWFALPDAAAWRGAGLGAVAIALAAAAAWRGDRARLAVALAGLAIAAGLALTWWRAERVGAPVLARPAVIGFVARVERVEPLAARDLVRLTLAPRDRTLPPRVRINLAVADMPATAGTGAMIRLRARLLPPLPAAVPGAYDYARTAWFAGIGATGRGLAPVAVLRPGDGTPPLREALTRHITAQLPGSAGGIAAALVTGDVGAITLDDADAMRAAGLAHLLSVSGLHITAVVGATMFVLLRLLALIPSLALRVKLPLVAGAAGAGAAIGYTLLTGSEVPTIRSCVAALLVLAALALGREAMTLRLVATGAMVVLLFWPESLMGPSFQLSFAAITAIVALHDHPRMRAFAAPRKESPAAHLMRHGALLLLTGCVVELALMPIAVHHFHKSGLYGAVANIVAIPLTTFVVMPLEMAALTFDAIGLGASLWWLTGAAIRLLLWIARVVAASPGAVTAWPVMPDAAYAAMVGGGLWLALWRRRWRYWGLVPIAIGAGWTASSPPPDLIVTGDGRHAALRIAGDRLAMLRDRTGDYTRDLLAAGGGVPVPGYLSDERGARCSADLCLATIRHGAQSWRVAMTRSAYPLPADAMIAACRMADIVVSDRRLPRGCAPRWLRLDRATLARSGGVAITFATGRIATVRQAGDRHPWLPPIAEERPRFRRAPL